MNRGSVVDVDGELPSLEQMLPWIEQIGFGVVAGFVSGYALKKVGKVLAIVLGIVFVVVQLLAWAGFVTVNWGVVQENVDPLLQSEALNTGWQNLVQLLTHNIPFAASFIPGFLFGLKKG